MRGKGVEVSGAAARGNQHQDDQHGPHHNEQVDWTHDQRTTARKQRALDLSRRLLTRFGLGEDTLLVIGKCMIAGTSWFLAETLLQGPSATFAPFSAVLIVHGTVSQSISHSVHFAVAMIAGVVLTGLLARLWARACSCSPRSSCWPWRSGLCRQSRRR